MKVKEGDILEFLAISWNEPQWEFDHPTVILQPIIEYSSNGIDPETMIENLAIDLCCNEDVVDEDVSEEFEWRRWKLSTLKRVAKEKLQGKDIWKTKIREVIKQKIKFIKDENNDLSFEVIETKRR